MATLTNGESSSTGGGDAPETSSSPNLKISLKLKDTEIAKLKRERDDAQAALEKVKEKNRMLVSILSQAETKEKAQILYKMEQLKAERTEFSSELTRMSTELEQERTRTRELAKELRKFQVRYLLFLPYQKVKNQLDRSFRINARVPRSPSECEAYGTSKKGEGEV